MKSLIDKNYLKSLAKDLMIEANDQELDYVLSIENAISQKLEKVISIDTENVKPTFYPLKDIGSFLREDDNPQVIDQKYLLENAPTKDQDYITVVKVVN
ncbi:aspartyl/glutamyl-tRNA(Asn/Gln) amidotransferase subunit C [Mycoplasma putrefaciens]|uniref:Aspartyl/glutamyl-tRNA(Asn/Gln) amidotransferase subunit C n=1 Tax=Mycoplasma putrefaciens (strain ATCC 15718 / NCTC 10155 / C30 KS-1 / KS-1) TaxID=743965 RepID=A0A7U4E9S7_MYCPK|nr:Asp-tRNA(Asn)/Glu-tRNA(Gln) amidotransferase subunit GatC [Mycoplasma putrefaciens]AEM68965.1 aspartyl/glutamyl-tRNA(Asn/Gln) amidotransferase subunit C [Mycoplasma putrefaciens KS1]SYV96461.1 aspartyl/glutamyl-tRNA(Asn/Gln) amidotransferase subunit C [Mycoplasma putrefaciens]